MGNLPIYATKGFEYLWILSFLAIFTVFYVYFTSKKFEPLPIAKALGLGSLVEWFRVPDDFHFHQGHTWAQAVAAEPGVAKVGMDDFAQRMAGRMDAVETENIGATLQQGAKGWSMRIGDKSIDMLSPISGEVVDVNREFLKNPSLANEDPFGDAWVYKVKSQDLPRESKNLFSGAMARKWMQDVVEKLRMRMTPELGVVYQDGGVPMPGMARHIDEKEWDLLLRDFFLNK